MANPRQFTLNATGGAYTTITASSVCRRVEIIEDFGANAGAGQGLEYLLPDPGNNNPAVPAAWDGAAGSTTTPSAATVGFKIAPQTEPIILGQVVPFGMGYGTVVGTPADNSGGYSIPATPYIQIRSASASTTVVRVTEFS